MRLYLARFTLVDGSQGSLQVIASHSCEVIDYLVAHMPLLHYCSARCVQ
jgi:hypothetical protein